MKSVLKAGAALVLASTLSACAGVGMVATLTPGVEDITQAELGNDQSYTDDAFDFLCESVFGGTLPRDPSTGDCS